MLLVVKGQKHNLDEFKQEEKCSGSVTRGGKSVAELGAWVPGHFGLSCGCCHLLTSFLQQALSMVPPRALTPSLGTREEKVPRLGHSAAGFWRHRPPGQSCGSGGGFRISQLGSRVLLGQERCKRVIAYRRQGREQCLKSGACSWKR